MAEQQSMRNVVWDKFTQVPSSPEIGENPVTKVLNMELSTHKTIRTRKGFGSVGAYASGPENQIITSLMNADNPLLIYKEERTLKTYDGRTFSSISPTGHYTGITPNTNGTFAVYGGELYYCESSEPSVERSALFAWDGTSGGGVRNLGVPGMTGKVPDELSGGAGSDPEKTVTICSARDFTDPDDDCGCACDGDNGTDFYVFEGGECEGYSGSAEMIQPPCPCAGYPGYKQCARAMPGFMGLFCWHVPLSCGEGNEGRGEKILNCAFRVGLYDPKRNIYGRAGDPKAVIKFGRTRGQFSMYQYQILVDLSNFDGSGIKDAGYRVAVWCTTGIEVLDYKHWKKIGNTDLMLTGNSHAMSDFLGGQTFLEGIYNAEGAGNPEIEGCEVGKFCLYKDQTLLSNSPPYSHTYERPIPSKAMCVLGNMALYFYPIAQDITQEPYDRNNMTQWGNYKDEIYETFGTNEPSYRFGAEYSVGHPEQIGRYTDAKETFTPLPYLKGDPVIIFNDAGNNIMITRQGLYSIGFNNGAQLQDLGGPGIITSKSFHPTSSGVMYVADEGPVWLQGGKAVPVIRELGFDGWFDDLNIDEKKEVRVGFIEDSKKILASFPIPSGNASGNLGRYRYLMHDVETSFTSEWWIGSGQENDPDEYRDEQFPGIENTGTGTSPDYMSSFRSNYGYQFLLFTGGSIYKYNDTEQVARISVVEMWINENSNLTKQLKTITADLGSCNGGLIVRVSTFDNPRQFSGGNEEATETRTLDLGDGDVYNRMLLSHFMGMRGKYIRIRFETESSTTSHMEIAKVSAEVNYDNAPSSLGEPPRGGLTPA